MLDPAFRDIADRRDQIVFGEGYNPDKYLGGIRDCWLTVTQINQLDELGLFNMNDRHNNSPTVGQMVGFLRARTTDGWFMSGYCISPERRDFRVCYMGFDSVGKRGGRKVTPPTEQDVSDFTALFTKADIFRASKKEIYAWYD